MISGSTRRKFLAAGLAAPAAGLAGRSMNAVAGTQGTATPKVELRYRTLGRTGFKVTTVGFGCMITSDPSVIERAVEAGINYFDTARGYQGGNNERMLGAALKSRRKQVYISTKTHGSSKQAALSDLETSLRELGTDYVDIWYLHGVGDPGRFTAEILDALDTAKQQGKARFVGLSTHSNQAAVIEAAIQTGKIDVVLVAYNFTMFKTLEPALEAAAKAGLGVVAMKTMAGGFRKARPGSELHGKLSREGAMLAALKWVLRNPNVHTTIPSMTDMEQLEENLRAMAEPFTEADEKLLAQRLREIGPLYCRGCNRCAGQCPQGLPVPEVLRCLMYADSYGEFALAREQFLALPASVRQVRCDQCRACAVRCPNGVRVAERMVRAQEWLA
ncbi:MAG: aldo/keto reductase [Bryobacterales bacterium]|nr:aldo/keto reductase [Bryobacteraceae bacterium]MDW8131114.1 aldo/keto reductase [Bryobacterales bacterium]